MHGTGSISQRRLADMAGLMRSRDRVRVSAALDRFCRRFPQLFFAVYTSSGTVVEDLRQYGFWMLNRANFEDLSEGKTNDGGILLVMDAESKSASVTWGYLLDPYLSEEDTFICMSRAHAYWLESRFADGTIRMLEQLENILRKRVSQARRDPGKFEKKVAAPVHTGEVARRIREGHEQHSISRTEVES